MLDKKAWKSNSFYPATLHSVQPRHFTYKARLQKTPCAHCGSLMNQTCDHILPKHRGGKNHPDNYQVLCTDCNTKKGHKLESEL